MGGGRGKTYFIRDLLSKRRLIYPAATACLVALDLASLLRARISCPCPPAVQVGLSAGVSFGVIFAWQLGGEGGDVER